MVKKEKIRKKLYISEESNNLIKKVKHAFKNESEVIEHVLWLATKDKTFKGLYLENLKGKQKKLYERLLKRKAHENSYQFREAKLDFNENKMFQNMKSYNFTLLKNFGLKAKSSILLNMRNMKNYFQNPLLKKQYRELYFKIDNNFDLFYEAYLESRQHNINLMKTSNKKIGFNDFIDIMPNKKKKKIKNSF